MFATLHQTSKRLQWDCARGGACALVVSAIGCGGQIYGAGGDSSVDATITLDTGVEDGGGFIDGSVDAMPLIDGSDDATTTTDGGVGLPKGYIWCGTDGCDIAGGHVCCYPDGLGYPHPPPKPSCVDSGACFQGNAYPCLGTSDCSLGEICCLTVIGGGFTSECELLGSCSNNGSGLLCHSSADCVGPEKHCDLSQAPPNCN